MATNSFNGGVFQHWLIAMVALAFPDLKFELIKFAWSIQVSKPIIEWQVSLKAFFIIIIINESIYISLQLTSSMCINKKQKTLIK